VLKNLVTLNGFLVSYLLEPGIMVMIFSLHTGIYDTNDIIIRVIEIPVIDLLK